jgi:hypothetical protein
LRISITAATPREVEGVALAAALWILNTNHGHAALPGVANQFLTAPAVYSGKAEIRRIGRHDSGAFEATPLRRLPGQIPQGSGVSADFYFGRSVDHHFDRALTAVGTAARLQIRPALKGLGAGGPTEHRESHGDFGYRQETFRHNSPLFYFNSTQGAIILFL